MAERTTVYQCPACTGPLHFDGKLGKLKCDYCGSAFTLQEAEDFYREKNRKAAQADKEVHKKADEAEAAAEAAAKEAGCRCI